MGVAEMSMVTTAAGLALAGKKPFASTFAIFLAGRALEVVRQSVALPKLNVKLVAAHGGLTVGEDGASHQMVEDIANMRILPNMTVIVPSDGLEMESIMRTIHRYEGPVYVRMSREAFPLLHESPPDFQIGKAETLRNGDDVSLIACGRLVSEALLAADRLAETGVQAGVINMSTIKPLDTEAILEAANRCGAIVTAEEHLRVGGLGSAVSETLTEGCPVPLRRVGVDDTFGRSGKPGALLELFKLTAPNIVSAAQAAIKAKTSRA
jgi:transketolase